MNTENSVGKKQTQRVPKIKRWVDKGLGKDKCGHNSEKQKRGILEERGLFVII
jgi:hypothetical protein